MNHIWRVYYIAIALTASSASFRGIGTEPACFEKDNVRGTQDL